MKLRGTVRAIIFDVDGTLYRQAPLQMDIMKTFVQEYWSSPGTALVNWRIIRAYRVALERLRNAGPCENMADMQLQLASSIARVPKERAAGVVSRWFDYQPLAVLARCIQPGLRSFLEAARAHGIRMGAASDYEAGEKLRALSVEEYFDAVVSSRTVGLLKPSPAILRAALERLAAVPGEALHVGDRLDVDGPAALAAGMRSVILSGSSRHGSGPHVFISSYAQLSRMLFGGAW